ncbi:monovalent cation/H+ antiporter subunit D [Ectothiorhodospira lacustris]|uniref:monovalent cation/H+ antiporter subunit D n=1 Tax=Ectothiorhodospira lacustris TaxID=2899127 RepID=UPI001EE91F89|nr:monovalent cation/H+ antiporter subunit D [Ectothiorhodospira lacustris]MCG5501195.1 monovalent cation/H+ antiporter subunit D [Ectothiorhodospira lacustris]MCG5511353.1 monovalent cation/H+ antiporter subunit D [Ectothiorhodospira lacustris]MCG5523139.1 monovalent cation/H+ antiporter subunit D [Ectothiorhodospira lacustris]
MNHWIILPILVPAVVAPMIVLAVRHDIVLARIFSVASAVIMLLLGGILMGMAADGQTQMYALGNWPMPFGIVLVLDQLSALMLVLTAVLGLVVLLYAIDGWDRHGRHFHALFQLQLMGINGAFLTGDLFNLFVFFEILLIASYGLMVHGGGPARMRAGVQYVIVNLVGSSVFLVAIGLIYGVTGTLNMADLAVRVPEVGASEQALLQTGALLLLLVFGVKAALVPVHFWLPGTYALAPAPVAALFAIMTKVGAYSIIRMYTLVFGDGAGEMAGIAADWLLPAALVTLVVGMVGVLASRSLGQMVSFGVIGSMGTLLAAVALFTPAALSAGLYYLLHSTLAAAALFLIVGLVVDRRPGLGDDLVVAPTFAQAGLIAGGFFLAAIAMVGMPPLAGFLGKLLILDAARDTDAVVWIWSLILATSLLAIIGFGRGGSTLFWKSSAVAGRLETDGVPESGALSFVAVGLLLAALVFLTVFAGPVTGYLDATAAQLFETRSYIGAVLD